MPDQDAIQEWMPEAYRDYLHFLARIWSPPSLRRKMDASDLAQDALLKAHAKRDQFQGTSSGQYKAWLRTTLRNTVLDAIQKYERRPEQSVCEFEASSRRFENWLEGEQTSPSEPAVRDELLERLSQYFAGLAGDQQEVLVLKHCVGLKVSAIAEATGRTAPSVAGLLRRGLKQLRRQFSEE